MGLLAVSAMKTFPEMGEAYTGLIQPLPPRSFGSLDLALSISDGVTRVRRAFQQGVVRVRFPNPPDGAAPEAVLVNTAGGLTGGDRIDLRVALEEGASATITTQAHEKVYRASHDMASVVTRISAAPQSVLEWLPQPTILFDRSRLRRRTQIVLDEGAVFLGLEAVIFGRSAMAETMRGGALDDHWTIRRCGRLIHADRFAVEGEIASRLTSPSVLDGNVAMATLRYVADDARAKLETARNLLRDDGAASAWNGMLLARVVAKDGYQLFQSLSRLLTGLRGRPLPSVWTI